MDSVWSEIELLASTNDSNDPLMIAVSGFSLNTISSGPVLNIWPHGGPPGVGFLGVTGVYHVVVDSVWSGIEVLAISYGSNDPIMIAVSGFSLNTTSSGLVLNIQPHGGPLGLAL